MTTKQCTAWNLQKFCANRDPVPTFVAENKVKTLYLGPGTVPEFKRGYLKKWFVHITWAPSVKAVLYNVS